jgi:hypothetical protein
MLHIRDLITRIFTAENTDDERIRRLEQRIDELEQKRLDDLRLTVQMWKSLTIDREHGDNHN